VKRVFLDWQRPPLLSAVEWLRTSYAQNRDWDLQNLTVVVPGRRVGRRLLERLVFEAEAQKLRFTPPEISTEGRLPELLYRPKFPFADTLTQDLAWRAALEFTPESQRAAVIPHPPAADDARGWLVLARMIRRLHTELAAEGLDFSMVVEKASQLDGFAEHDRWSALAAMQNRYLRTLDKLELWDIQTARLEGIKRKEFATTREIVLLGTVDLNHTMRNILDQVTLQVTALIAAPEAWIDRFDEHGCIIPFKWQGIELPLADHHIEQVDDATDQAEAVARKLAAYNGRYRADQITLGVPDERLVPQLQRRLDQCGIASRWVQGKLVSQTGPYRLLRAIESLVEGMPADAVANLLRHPDVYQWLGGPDLLPDVDDFRTEYLPIELSTRLWPWAAENAKTKQGEPRWTKLREALEKIEKWLAPLAGKKKLAEWTIPLLAAIREVYASAIFDRTSAATRDTQAGLEAVAGALHGRSRLPAELDSPVSASYAIHLALEELADTPVPPPSDGDAIEMLGWLELPLDDAPAMIVTTFNEGFVPDSVSADPFLPNTMRRMLGLIDNDRRFARDAYSVGVIASSRPDVLFLSARRDSEGNPLAPSRLQFLASPEVATQRAIRCFAELKQKPPRVPLVGSRTAPLPETRLPRPAADPRAPLPRVYRVTQLREYLNCPYRYYLRYVLGLAAQNDEAEELNAPSFGSLIHDCLQSFGEEKKVRESDSPKVISAFLNDQLSAMAKRKYGEKSLRAAIAIQLEQVRARLERFALWQAKRSAEGWRIIFTETLEQNLSWKFTLDEEPFILVGRIDRIDRHDTTGIWQILDYKTGDKGESPNETHGPKNEEWQDFQLPLYRHLAGSCDALCDFDPNRCEFGYVLLPKDLSLVGLSPADWSSEQLQEADEQAFEILRNIRDRKFEPSEKTVRYEDDLSAICQDRRRAPPRVIGDESDE
jgi:ATP-dependent helicase/nuclease subunit B